MDKIYLILDGYNYPIEAFKYLASAKAFAECYNSHCHSKYDKCRIVEKAFGDSTVLDYIKRHK